MIAVLERDNSWRDRAACNGVALPVFFPQDAHPQYKRARQLCAGCEVLGECRADVMATEPRAEGARHGFRAGMTPTERYAKARR